LIIYIDLDRTICFPGLTKSTAEDEVKYQITIKGARKFIRKAKRQGHQIFIYTHRHPDLASKTCDWLFKNKIKVDGIIFDKPKYDLFIDDKAYHFTNWTKLEKRFLK